jgi:FkbM family methyltransferase
MLGSSSDQKLEFPRSLVEYPFTLIDVGAGGGINRRRWGKFRNLTVIGFEPDEREFIKLKDSVRHRWCQVALYGSEGVFDLNVTRYQTNTSLLEPNLELIQTLNVPMSDFDILRKVPLPCRTLDALCSEQGLVPHVIKLDTQGTEIDILKGGEKCLRRSIFAVEAEVEFLPLYKNQALFTDVHNYLSSLGFQLMDYLSPVRIRGREFGCGRGMPSHLLSADALYFKSPFRLVEDLLGADPASFTAAVAICVAYDFDDYAQELCRIALRKLPDLEARATHHLHQLQSLPVHKWRKVRDFLTRFKILRSIGKRLKWFLTAV